jgi:DNA polymerase eta
VLVPIDECPSEPTSAGGSEDQSLPASTWHDVALLIAAKMMAKVRTDIYQQLGYSTSAVCGHFGLHDILPHVLRKQQGIARNKFLAKV